MMVSEIFGLCAAAAEQLIASDAVGRRWQDASALEGYTVAGLAGHLSRAVLTVEPYLDAAGRAEPDELADAAGYFVAVLASHDPVDSDFHRTVRARGAEQAADGPVVLAAAVRDARTRLAARLDAPTLRQVVTVRDGVTMTVEDYLRTRVVELVVHCDDLAASVGHDPEALPAEAYPVAAAVLAEVAVRRAGGLATVRSLSRRERQPHGVAAL